MKYNHFNYFRSWKDIFAYSMCHRFAYNMVAMNLGVWKWHHLFHDFDKPLLALLFPYLKVHEFHCNHSNHHLAHYYRTGKCNWIDLVIDWESAQYTKPDCTLTARDYLNKLLAQNAISADKVEDVKAHIIPILDEYEL